MQLTLQAGRQADRLVNSFILLSSTLVIGEVSVSRHNFRIDHAPYQP